MFGGRKNRVGLIGASTAKAKKEKEEVKKAIEEKEVAKQKKDEDEVIQRKYKNTGNVDDKGVWKPPSRNIATVKNGEWSTSATANTSSYRERSRSRRRDKSSSANTFVFLDLAITNPHKFECRTECFRLKIELFMDVVPKTAGRFEAWCRRGKYEKIIFHRIIPQHIAQGGDVTHNDGTGGQIDGHFYEDENFILRHDRPGLLSCANIGPNTNTTQFFILLDRENRLNGRHTVFGEIKQVYFIKEAGHGDAIEKTFKPAPLNEVLYNLSAIGTRNGVVKGKAEITDCGEILGDGHE